MLNTIPQELLIHDAEQECPYLPQETARMPLRLPVAPLDRSAMSAALARGDRRCGRYLYRTQCPACKACEPMRVLVDSFRARRTHARILRRGDERFTRIQVSPVADQEHLDLFNKHSQQRGLGHEPLSLRQYAAFLVETCCESFEIQYRQEGRLVAVAVNDRASDSISAVYCYYDPDEASASLGTYSILKLIELCREWQLPFLYLGLYVAANSHMSYKARYTPHERLIAGQWRRHVD